MGYKTVVLECAVACAFCARCLSTPAEAASPASAPAAARPSPQQAAWQDLEVGMFIHFAPNTWQDQEYDDLSTPLEKINPARLDTDQWVRVAEDMGARYIVFVAKHVGGFCMWQTETTDYSIAHTPWKAGKGDVLADLIASCKKRGMLLGVYVSPADRKHDADVGGKCKTPEAQAKYNELYRRQLTEVLSRHSMMEVWFDGSIGIPVGDILERYAPKAMVFQGPHATIRWVGNEEGYAKYPAWNAVGENAARGGVATGADGDPDGAAWLPNECDARMRRDWFWASGNASTLKTVDQLMDMYYRSVGHGCVLLLNNTPDTSGRIPEADARRAADFGAEVRRRFARSLAETAGHGREIVLKLEKPTIIDHVIAMEDITQGQRVRDYVVEGRVDSEWFKICEGTAVGHKKIDRFKPVTVSAVRLRCRKAADEPIIRKLAVYNTLRR